MMVLVDTTVWIDFFASQPFTHVEVIEDLISKREDICISGVILTEVLQGIRKDYEYKRTRKLFENLIYLPMNYGTFIRSAEIYRTLRKKGITIRRSLDCMIAAVAIENSVPLLHNDRDFDPITEYCNLQKIPLK